MRSSINPSKAEWAPVLHAHASSSRTTYRFGQVATVVDVDDPEAARWLAEFLSPCFSTDAPDGTAPSVGMTSSGEQFSALARIMAERNPQPLACFRLDRRVVSCPGWTELDGTIFAADQEFGCYYQVRGGRVQVISRPQDRPARIGLMRVVRELAMLRVCSQPQTLDLHAAAFVFRGRAVLLAGDKNAGKTTLLAHALTSPQTALMANDRVIIDSQFEARGVPTIVSVRADTEQTFPALGRRLPRRAALLHEGELAAADSAQFGIERPLVLSLAQFARQLKSRLEPSAPVGAVLFPEISTTTSGCSLEPMAPAEAAARLRGNIYGSALATHTDIIFQRSTKSLPAIDGQDPLAGRLPAIVPMIRCVLGKRAYSANSDAWLRTLPIGDGVTPR